jgi:pyruvate dehydrogenase E2 component (dihydrolipoamide acetyltransferase)
MPQPGQMTEECTVLQWHKSVGDEIAKGDVLYEIETDKSNMDVEAFDTGTLLAIVVDVGQTVPVDTVVAWIGAPGEEIPTDELAAASGSDANPSPSQPSGTGDAEQLTIEPAASTTPRDGADHGPRIAMSPRASRTAIEMRVDLASVVGTGPGGRIVERDVLTAGAGAQVAAKATPGPTTLAAVGMPGLAAGTSGPAAVAPASPASPSGAGAPERLSRLRRVIARRLTESATTIPSFTVGAAIDVTDLLALRADLKAAGSAVSITDLVHAATIGALVEHPLVNSVTDGEHLWRREAVHLGIAVSIPGGLLVPIVRDAQSLELPDLSSRSRAIVGAAREGKLGPDELSGSTFTVSNMGMFGVDTFSAIINPGESGILAVSAIKPRVVAMDHGIVTRSVMQLTLTADHRLVDGELGARFVETIRARLEDASTFDVGGESVSG